MDSSAASVLFAILPDFTRTQSEFWNNVMKSVMHCLFVLTLIVIPIAGCGDRNASRAPEGAGAEGTDPAKMQKAAELPGTTPPPLNTPSTP